MSIFAGHHHKHQEPAHCSHRVFLIKFKGDCNWAKRTTFNYIWDFKKLSEIQRKFIVYPVGYFTPFSPTPGLISNSWFWQQQKVNNSRSAGVIICGPVFRLKDAWEIERLAPPFTVQWQCPPPDDIMEDKNQRRRCLSPMRYRFECFIIHLL